MTFFEVLTTYNSLLKRTEELRKKVEESELQDHFYQHHLMVLNCGYSSPLASISLWNYRGMLSEVEYLIEEFNKTNCFIKIPEARYGEYSQE